MSSSPSAVPTALSMAKLLAPVRGASYHPALALEMRRLGGPSPSSSPASAGSPSASSSNSSNVRSLVSRSFIPRGSVLATVPEAATLRGPTAHATVREMLGHEKYRRLLDFAASRDGDKKKNGGASAAAGASSSSSSSSPSSYDARSDNTFVSLASRDCILMLCALASTRAFAAQQRHIAAAAKQKRQQQQLRGSPNTRNNNNSSNNTNTTAVIEEESVAAFAALRMAAPPPQWLLHWCKFGLPARHFAAGLAVAEAQKLKLEPIERRRLNIIQDKEGLLEGGNGEDRNRLLLDSPTLTLGQGGGGESEASSSSNMGFFPSPIPPADYIPSSAPRTLLDAEGMQLAPGAPPTISTHFTRREPTMEKGIHQLGGIADLASRAAAAQLEGGGGASQQHQLTDGGNNDGAAATSAAVVEDDDDGSGKPPLLRALERIASGADREAIGTETRNMIAVEEALQTARDAVVVTSSENNGGGHIAVPQTSRGPTSVEPFAANRTRDLVELVATPSMVTKFLRDEPIVLSEAKQRMLAAHRHGETAGFGELALRTAALDRQLLRPIAKILSSSSSSSSFSSPSSAPQHHGEKGEGSAAEAEEGKDGADGDDDDDGTYGPILEDLRWAHAMLRSRAVNANWPSTGRRESSAAAASAEESAAAAAARVVEPSLIPVVDLLNHAPHSEANATFIPAVRVSTPTTTSSASEERGRAEGGGFDSGAETTERCFNIVASRDIQPGEMVSLFYGHYRQRTILFEADPAAAAEALANSVAAGGLGTGVAGVGGGSSAAEGGGAILDLSTVPNAARERLAVTLDMKRIEDQQRFGTASRNGVSSGRGNGVASSSAIGFGSHKRSGGGGAGYIDDDALNDAKGMHRDPRAARRRLDVSVTESYFERNAIEAHGGDSSSIGGAGEQPRRGTALREGGRAVTAKKFSGLSDADWSWFFGFTKSDEEKGAEARKAFERDLNKRVAAMVNPRRRGRRGEYVVGVPPGLSALQEHRARLQEEQYGGHVVFPPQRV